MHCFLKNRINTKITARPLKQQILMLFLPVTLVIVLLICVFTYNFEMAQVKTNASYLIEATATRTSSVIDEKLSIIFSQLSKFSESNSLGSLLINNYSQDTSRNKYNDILNCYQNMQNVYYTYSDAIDSMYFCTNNGVEITAYTDLIPADTSIDLAKWFHTYKDNSFGYYWRNLHEDDVFKTKYSRPVLSVFRNIGSINSPAQGLVVINLKPSYFKRQIDNSQISQHGYLMLVSKDGAIKSDSIQKEYTLNQDDMKRLQNGQEEKGKFECTSAVGNNKLLVTYKGLETNDWRLVVVVPQEDLTAVFSQLKYVLLLIAILLAAVFVCLSINFAKSISRPIEVLSQKVKEFDLGNDKVDFSEGLNADNEIGTLAMGLSQMGMSVNNLFEQVKKEQIQKSKIELLALQSQIKPHFLYNTLASIRHLIDQNDMRKASEMCSGLEKFYMIGISGGREIISVQEEVEHVRNYLRIQQMRYAEDFDFSIEMDHEILSAPILKLTLQPLVENAIYHGIKTKEGKGIIVLTGQKKDTCMIFEVYDDGVGMDEEELKTLRASVLQEGVVEDPKNFGLRNVNMRLKLYFGAAAFITFDSVKDAYTQVTITIPLDENGKGDRNGTPTSDR